MTSPAPEPLSVRNPRVQQLRRLLGRRSPRADAGRFVIEGETLVAEALGSEVVVEDVFVEPAVAAPEVRARAAARPDVRLHTVAPGVIARVGSTVSPQPCVAIARSVLRPTTELLATAADRLVLVLVDVNDPGNAGAVMRSAEAAGAGGVVVLGASVDPLNPKAVRAAAGSLFRLAVSSDADVGLGLATVRASGRRLVGAVARGGQPHDGSVLAPPVAVVLGSETHGLAPAVADDLDATVSIAMAGGVESLNLAMAATLLAFEAARHHPRPDAG